MAEPAHFHETFKKCLLAEHTVNSGAPNTGVISQSFGKVTVNGKVEEITQKRSSDV